MTDFRDAVRSGLIEYMEGLEKALDGLDGRRVAVSTGDPRELHRVDRVAHGPR